MIGKRKAMCDNIARYAADVQPGGSLLGANSTKLAQSRETPVAAAVIGIKLILATISV